MPNNNVTVSCDSIQYHYQLRIGKPAHTYIIFKISKEHEIIVEHSSESTDFDEFLLNLPEDEPRYAVYLFKKEKHGNIIFFNWLPEGASIDQKYFYERSKHVLLESIAAINLEVTGHTVYDYEMTYENIVAQF